MKYAVWYMKPSWFLEGNCARRRPDTTKLGDTHVHVRDVEVKTAREGWELEEVYHQMQGEVWSPNGEARGLIKRLGLQHTSMSVGDVAIDEAGQAHIVASFGFEALSN